jgi:hypothetical protein
LTHAETLAALEGAGFREKNWDDVSDEGKRWIARQQQQFQDPSRLGLSPSPGLVLGARLQPMVANFARNILEGRVRLVMGIFEAI